MRRNRLGPVIFVAVPLSAPETIDSDLLIGLITARERPQAVKGNIKECSRLTRSALGLTLGG